MSNWERTKRFIKDAIEWIVVVALFISGYFLWGHLFKKTKDEEEILDNIKTNEDAISELEKMAKELDKKDSELEEKEKKLTALIDIKSEEIKVAEEDFAKKKKKIAEEKSDVQSNIDYLNKKL